MSKVGIREFRPSVGTYILDVITGGDDLEVTYGRKGDSAFVISKDKYNLLKKYEKEQERRDKISKTMKNNFSQEKETETKE